MELDALRYLEPDPSGHHAVGEIRASHACREGAEGAVGTGMAVRADDDITGHHKPFFGKEGMLDAAGSAFVEVRDAVFFRKLPDHLAVLRREDILVRRKVVEDKDHLFRIEDTVRAHLVELLE